MDPRVRSRLAASIAVACLTAGWLGWLALPPGTGGHLAALWLATGIVVGSLYLEPRGLERTALAGLRGPRDHARSAEAQDQARAKTA